MSQSPLRTPLEARAWLERHGVTATEWARANGFEPAVVYALLSGRTHGRRGHAHHAAVALGLKGGAPDGETPPLTSTAKTATTSTLEKASHANEPNSNFAGGPVMS